MPDCGAQKKERAERTVNCGDLDMQTWGSVDTHGHRAGEREGRERRRRKVIRSVVDGGGAGGKEGSPQCRGEGHGEEGEDGKLRTGMPEMEGELAPEGGGLPFRR